METVGSRCGCSGCQIDSGCSVCGKCLPSDICGEATLVLGGYGVSEEDAEAALCCFPEDGGIGFPLYGEAPIEAYLPPGAAGLRTWTGFIECGGLAVSVQASVYTLDGVCYITGSKIGDTDGANTRALDASWAIETYLQFSVELDDDMGILYVAIGGSDWFHPGLGKYQLIDGEACIGPPCLCRCLPTKMCVFLELRQRPDLGIVGVPNSGSVLCTPEIACRSVETITVDPVIVTDICGQPRSLAGCLWAADLQCDDYTTYFQLGISRTVQLTTYGVGTEEYDCGGIISIGGEYEETFLLSDEDCTLPSGSATLAPVALPNNKYYEPVITWRPSPCENCEVDELYDTRCDGACFSADVDAKIEGPDEACNCSALAASLISDCEEYQGSWAISYGGCSSPAIGIVPEPPPGDCPSQDWWYVSSAGEEFCDPPRTYSLQIRLGYQSILTDCPENSKNVGEDITRYRLLYTIGSVEDPIQTVLASPISGSCNPFRLDFEVPSPNCCYTQAILRITG